MLSSYWNYLRVSENSNDMKPSDTRCHADMRWLWMNYASVTFLPADFDLRPWPHPTDIRTDGYFLSFSEFAFLPLSLLSRWFPYEPVPFSPKLGPYIEYVEKDHVYYWCSCGESITQPWCDNVGCEGTKFKPVAVIPHESGKKWFCGSKHSPTKPEFNGTCWSVWMDVNTIPAAGVLFSISFATGIICTWLAHPWSANVRSMFIFGRKCVFGNAWTSSSRPKSNDNQNMINQ